MWEGLLPIGSIVRLRQTEKLIMIIGTWQVGGSEETTIYDYAGVTYPEGYINRDILLGFGREEVTEVLYVGYMDTIQHFYMERLEPIMDGLKSGELTEEEADEAVENMLYDLANYGREGDEEDGKSDEHVEDKDEEDED